MTLYLELFKSKIFRGNALYIKTLAKLSKNNIKIPYFYKFSYSLYPEHLFSLVQYHTCISISQAHISSNIKFAKPFNENDEFLMKIVASILYAQEAQILSPLGSAWNSLLGFRINNDTKLTTFTFNEPENNVMKHIQIRPNQLLNLKSVSQNFIFNLTAIFQRDENNIHKISGELSKNGNSARLKFVYDSNPHEIEIKLITSHEKDLIKAELILPDLESKIFYLKTFDLPEIEPIDQKENFGHITQKNLQNKDAYPVLPGKVVSALIYTSDPNKDSKEEFSIESKINGKIIQIYPKIGQKIEKGDSLIAIEAMKLETVIRSPISGSISSINCKIGDFVKVNQVLINLIE